MKRQSPVGTVPQVYAIDPDIGTSMQEEQLRTCCLAGALAALVIIRIGAFALMMQAVDMQCQGQSLPVDGAAARDADVLCPVGHDKRHRGIVVTSIVGMGHTDGLIVIGIGTAQKYGSFFQKQLHARTHHQTTRQISALGQHQSSTTFLTYIVNGLLQLLGAERSSVGRYLQEVCPEGTGRLSLAQQR